MLEASVNGGGVGQVHQRSLEDASQPLEQRGINDHDFMGVQAKEPENRVADYLLAEPRVGQSAGVVLKTRAQRLVYGVPQIVEAVAHCRVPLRGVSGRL
jgi:hypothetical protein